MKDCVSRVLVAQSCPTLRPHGLQTTRLLCPWDFPGHFLLQGVFSTQGSYLGLLHCRQILYRLSYKGSLMKDYFPLLLSLSINCKGIYSVWEKETSTHSSTLAWKIPWTEEPDGLQSGESQRVQHDWVTSLSFTFTFILFDLFAKAHFILFCKLCYYPVYF